MAMAAARKYCPAFTHLRLRRAEPKAESQAPLYNAVVEQPPIRLATLEDLDALLKLERQVPAAAHWSRAAYLAIFQLQAPSRLCLVADNGELQAFLVARTAGPEWELENIVVAPAALRRGLATRLVQGLLERARQRGTQSVWLEVRASNLAARALYQSCGFAESGLRPGYYQEPVEDALLYAYRF